MKNLTLKLTAFLCLAVSVASAANHLNNVGVLVDDTGSSVLALYGFTTGTPHTNNFGFLIDDTGALVVTGISSGSGDALTTSPLSQFAATTSAQLAATITNETGTGLAVFATSPTLVTPVLGTPTSGTLTNATGLPIAGVTGWGTGVDTFVATPTSANLASALTNETGTGVAVFNNTPTLIAPLLGTPTSGVMTNVTGLTEAGQTLADNTTGNATTSAHGYLLKLNNSATSFMNGQGAWATPAGGATAALDNLASVAINSALLPGTDNSIASGDATHRWTNISTKAMACGVGGTTSCVITGSGSTSGTATITWPATAGTTTNPIVFSNNITVPVGSKTLGASFNFAGAAATGIYQRAGVISLTNGTSDLADIGVSSGLSIGTSSGGAGCFAVSSGDLATVATDVFLCRTAAGVFSIGNSGTPNSVGALKLSSVQIAGTKFASNAGCTEGTLVGGATAGKFTVGQGTACTIVITMGDSATAPNGWACSASDQTAVPAVAIRQTASNTTTASLLMTVATSDVVSFSCIGY